MSRNENMPRDIKAIGKITRSEEMYRNLVEMTTDIIYQSDREGNQVFMNDAGYRTLEALPEEVIGQQWSKWIHPDDRENTFKKFKEMMELGIDVFDFENRYVSKRGRMINVLHNVRVIRNENGEIVGTQGIARDITERKRGEEALKVAIAKAEEEKNKSNAILDAIGDNVITQDTDYKIIYQNQVNRDSFGDRIGEYCYKVYENRNAICEGCPLEISFRDGRIHKAIRSFSTEKGTQHIEYTTSPLRDSTRKIIAGIKIVRDITERQHAEKTLRESEQKYRTLFETMAQGVVYQDAEGKIISANPAAERILGLTFDQMSGRTSMDPGWKAVHEDGSDFPGETHPSMVALRTGREVRDVVMGVFNPLKEEYRWIIINAVPQFRTVEDKPYQVYTIFDDITGRKRTEEKLQEGERFLASIFESIQDGIGIIDKDMNILHVNPTARKWYPHTKRFVGRKCYEAYHNRSERCEFCPAWQTIKSGKSAYEVVAKHGPGGKEVGWLEIYSFPMCDTKTGEMRGVIEYVRDITGRKKVEEALQKSIRQQNSILNNIPDIAWLKDKESRFIAVNEPFAKACGVSPEELVGKTDLDIWPQELAERYRADDREVMATGRRKQVEEPMVDKDGKKMWIETIKTPIYNDRGEVIGTTGIARDITERKRVEDSLKLFSEAVEGAPDGVQIVDLEGRIIYSNRAVEEIFGFTREKLKGRHVNEMNVDPELAGKTIIPSIIETGRWVGELMVKHKDGREFPIWLTASMVKDRKGKPIAMVGIIRDITERRRTEEVLRLSNLVVENSPTVLFRWKAQEGWPVEFVSKNVALFGYSVEDFLSGRLPYASIVYPEDMERVAREVNEHSERGDERFQQEYRILTKNGAVRWIDDRTVIERDGNGRITHYQGIIIDITERKKVEEEIKKYASELEESNRIKELFIDIMHHDLINPLTAASGFIELLKEDEIISRKRVYLETIEKNLVKALELMESATRLSKLESSKSIELTDMDLEKVINDVIGNLSPLAADAGMKIENRINISMPVRANKIIEEVFTNIMSNAVKYASDGKRIIVDCEEKKGCWNIRVTDFGEGIEDRDKKIIFDRFHRMEKKGVKGSGLGLAIASKIIELHKGRIWVEDNPEGGAVFVVEIPKILQ